MAKDLPPIVLKGKLLKKFHFVRRKYPVSMSFLHSNWGNVKRFLIYALNPRCVLRIYCRRRRNRVLLLRRARILLIDPRLKKMIRKRKKHMKQWSSRLVAYYKKVGKVTEYEETEVYGEELSKQMKQQLELLKSGKRGLSLIEDANKNVELRLEPLEDEKQNEASIEEDRMQSVEETTDNDSQIKKNDIEEQASISKKLLASKATEETASEQSTEKMISQSAEDDAFESPQKLIIDDEFDPESRIDQEQLDMELIEEDPVSIPTEEEPATKSVEAPSAIDIIPSSNSIEKTLEKSGGNFLDMLMNKVRVKNFAKESNFSQPIITSCPESSTSKPSTVESNSDFSFNDDASEDFVGFDETAHQPGMLLTPLVPQSCKTTEGNGAFVSEALDAYMKKNNLREDRERLLEPMYQDGRVTRHSMPPYMDAPAVPDSLQKLRTVAERRLYLQRSKNQKMAIINNEANIYRELQRKQRQRKVKIAAMQQLQSSGSQMPFTRQGWQAASYVSTEQDKYYYQVIRIDGEMVRLPGSQGNNLNREKQPHRNQLTPKELAKVTCNSKCVDANLRSQMQIINTRQIDPKKLQKLNQSPLKAILPPCPLSQKVYQKPLDDDTAALLLAGGSMAVVSMPTVRLDVKPQLGRPLEEIAKRYLQYILPHHDITREWAEFSVSTLQESPNSMREAEAQAATTNAGRRKSFTFVIPYLNDRNHILVRRVVDRSEELDEHFSATLPEEKLTEFEFRKELTETSDPIAWDCADMISDLINTVTISCCENSFTTIDPDAITPDSTAVKSVPAANNLLSKTIGKAPPNKQQQQRRVTNNNYKQSRLAKELRRLNATIIDAGAIAKDANKPCLKDHCRLGCLCESLAGARPSREHCGRAECVIRCSCSGAEPTRIMRVETDGRGLSNEDAFNLRRQATARLAKMEKDFTSTLVLTDNETLLINETQCDKKRRCTKAPKRYDDFDDSIEDDEEPVRPSKVPKRETSTKSSAQSVNLKSPLALPLPQPCKVKDTDFEQLRHCQIALRRLPDMANQAIFCMTHQLYNCFCGGLAPDGKPIIIEKEKAEPPVPHYVPELATRAHYSFERAQETPPPLPQGKKKQQKKQQPQQQPQKPQQQQQPQKRHTPSPPPASPPSSLLSSPSSSPRPVQTNKNPVPSISTVMRQFPPRDEELEIIYSFFRSRPLMCRRTVAVPKKCYLRVNRRRADRLRSEISKTETPYTQMLLNKRVFGAIRFYRAELDNQRRMEKQLSVRQKQELAEEPTVILVRDDSDEGESGPNIPKRKRSTASFEEPGVSLLKPPNKRNKEDKHVQTVPKPVKKQMPPIRFVPIAPKPAPAPPTIEVAAVTPPTVEVTPPTVEVPPPTVEVTPPISGQQQLPAASPQMNIQMPKISACYSLRANSAIEVPMSAIINHNETAVVANATGTSKNGQQQLNAPMNSPAFRSSYNDVIKKMNMHVSKKMQDIDMALQRESKIIPAPNEEILCIIKWANFVAAFQCGYVFIWHVQMKDGCFLAATITNMMPAVPGAIAVINTRFYTQSALPLMARMLLDGLLNENTNRLAVVMQGRENFWLVRGFLRSTRDACTKPTPQSHPILTKKINVLCTLMLKQKIREKHRLNKVAAKTTQPESVVELISSPTTSPTASPTTSPTASPTTSPSTSASIRALTPASTPTPPACVSAPASAPAFAPAPASSTSNSVLGLATTEASLTTESLPPPQIKTATINICSNIEFRKVTQADVNELQIPELHSQDHRWLVLDLFDDFSHIFVPAFRDMISLDRINHVLRMAHSTQKVVKLLFFQNAPYDAFVTSSSKRKIYFGPLRLDAQPPVLVLLQSVDGKMMLREVYQRDHGIAVQQNKRTLCFWLIQINKQVHFDIDMYKEGLKAGTLINNNNNSTQTLAQQQQQCQDALNANDNNEDDDDDCVIVIQDEDEDKEPQNLKGNEDEQQDKELELRMEQTAKSLQRLTHFTIQAVPNKSGDLHITSRPAASSSNNTKNVEHSRTLGPGRFLPINAQQMQEINQNNIIQSSLGPGRFLPINSQMPEIDQGTIIPIEPPLAKISRISSSAKQCLQLPKMNNSMQQLLGGGTVNGGGLTITKVNMNKDGGPTATATTTNATVSALPATPPLEPIKIGSKRKMSASSSAAAAAESMLEQIDMPSLGKLESLLMRPLNTTATTTTTPPQDSGVQLPAKPVEVSLPKIQFPPAIIKMLKGELKAAQMGKVKPLAETATATTAAAVNIATKPPIVAAQVTKLPTSPPALSVIKTKAAEKAKISSTAAASGEVGMAVVEINPSTPLAPAQPSKISTPTADTTPPKVQLSPQQQSKSPTSAAQNSLPSEAPVATGLRLSLPAKGPTEEEQEQEKSPGWPQTKDPHRARYGFLVANGLPRYRVKLLEGKFMVKMPEEGIYSFKNCAVASSYLNRTLSRHPKYKTFLPADWKFLPFDSSTIVIED